MRKRLLSIGLIVSLSVASFVAVMILSAQEKTEIKTVTISAQGNEGKVMHGENQGSSSSNLKTNTSLVFESPEIIPTTPKSNAAVLQWDQSEGAGEVDLEFRTANGSKWSEWVDANEPESERPDTKLVAHKALILADEIHKIQYRFEISGKDGQTSPEVNVTNAQLELIDSTKGPSPTKPNPLRKFLQVLGFAGEASAKADGPRIYSRAEWGSLEPNSSQWEPEYRQLHRAVVHHTATTMTSDPAAMIRAVWQFHTYNNGWGDIGYNYLVDGNGNIYQGRYFDPTHSNANRVDVVGGHAYEWNYGSTGIAALGNFTGTNGAPEPMLRAIGDIIAFKLHRYGVDPGGFHGDYPVVVGHKDVLPTACPANVHQHLPSIRVFASNAYSPYYRVDHQDYAYIGQGKNGLPATEITLPSGQTTNLYMDIQNTGIDTWRKDGAFPMRLGTKNPRDRASPFTTLGWLSPGRSGSFSHYVTGYNPDGTANLQVVDEILPGQVARFTIPVKAPESGGAYIEYFQPVIENYDWFMRDFNMHFKINVLPRSFAWHGTNQTVYSDASKSTIVSQSTTLTGLRGGQRYYVEAKIQNDGDQVWSNTGSNPVRLATFNPADRPSAVCNPNDWTNGCHRAATLEEATVNPGQVGTFGFWIEMPYHAENSEFKEYFNLVAEGLKWAPDQGMYWSFGLVGEDLRAHPTDIRAFQSDTMTNAQDLGQLTPGQRFYVSVHMRNDGNVTWRGSGLRQVRLGTTNPNDRSSIFCDPTWLSACNRITSSQDSTIGPGQTGRYGFWMQAPSAPGTYVEHVNLVAEGFSWFKNQNVPIVVTVK